jgi:hypothetical protein
MANPKRTFGNEETEAEKSAQKAHISGITPGKAKTQQAEQRLMNEQKPAVTPEGYFAASMIAKELDRLSKAKKNGV